MSVNHSQSRNSLGRAALCLVGVCLCLAAGAQSRYETLIRVNPWNGGSNAAGMRQDSVGFSNAEAGGLYRSGDFRDGSDAASEWAASAQARTMTHLEKFSMRGAFSFEDREAYDACGSMFLGRGKFPVDVLEFTPGRKSFQTYKMYGGLSVDIAPGWRVGGALDFSSRNAAKRKDLRYTGYALDMEVTPSLMYHSGDFAAGVSAIYARSTETVSAEQVGSAQSAPFAFFNEGLYFGNLQVWTGSGTRLREPGVSGLPVVQDALGAAAQLQPCRPVYAEADFRYLRGRVGERQTIWYRYEGPSASLRLELRTGAHTLRARGAWERLSNRESVLDKVVEGGITITREYGSNNIYRRNALSSSLEYEYLGDMLELRSGASYDLLQEISTPLYPFVYTREQRRWSAFADALVRFGSFETGAGLSYMQGRASGDSRLADSSASGVSGAYRHQNWYDVASEYATAPRLSASVNVRWRFFKTMYAEVFGDYVHAFDLKYISGPSRWDAGLKIGYNF